MWALTDMLNRLEDFGFVRRFCEQGDERFIWSQWRWRRSKGQEIPEWLMVSLDRLADKRARHLAIEGKPISHKKIDRVYAVIDYMCKHPDQAIGPELFAAVAKDYPELGAKQKAVSDAWYEWRRKLFEEEGYERS